MGVALLGFPHGKKNVSTRKSIFHTFGKVCAKFREYLEICRYQTINVHKWLDYIIKLTTYFAEKYFDTWIGTGSINTMKE